MLLLVKAPLQPPLPVAVANHVANLALMAACVCPKASNWLVGQFSTTVGGAATVKVAWQVWLPQLLLLVNVTVVLPPQAEGAPVLLLVMVLPQPPLPLAVANHVANAALTAACVWQAAVVVLVGQVMVTGSVGDTV